MESTSSDGDGFSLTITFAVGTDPHKAAVNVQTRMSLAFSRLPAEVNELGVSTKKRASNILLGVNLTSPGGTRDAIFLSNCTTINVRDPHPRKWRGRGDSAWRTRLQHAYLAKPRTHECARHHSIRCNFGH